MIKKINYIFLSLLTSLGGLFTGLENAIAVDINTNNGSGVIISEVMANASGSDLNHEWTEITNVSSLPIDLGNFSLKIYNDPLTLIPKKTFLFPPLTFLDPGDYLVVVQNASNYLPCSNCAFFDGQFSSTSITNSKGKISLTGFNYEYDFIWNRDVGDGYSMEVIGPPVDVNYINWHSSLQKEGTPGEQNSVSNISLPKKPDLISPQNNQNFNINDEIEFTYESEQDINYQVFISKDNLQFYLFDDIDAFDVGTYFWKVKATNVLDQSVESDVRQFQINEPVYSNDIVVNEIMPDPEQDETTNEWIELYNNSALAVNLKNWILGDILGTTKTYKINNDFNIDPYGFAVLNRSQTGITLNNDSDGVRLYQPNNNLLFQTPIFSKGDEGWSWARKDDGVWSWTEVITPLAKNIISLSQSEDEDENFQPVNSEPIEISTGDVGNYENHLVTVLGEVIETSGSTFYLDDGSGKIKIYIQSKTNIEKPEMHKGDIFLVTGIVNLYGNTWRILPRVNSDIKLIQPKISIAKSKSKKTNAKSKSVPTSKKSVLGKAKAASVKEAGKTGNTFFNQFILSLTSLALIFLLLLIVKVLKKPKDKIIGGHFGEDET